MLRFNQFLFGLYKWSSISLFVFSMPSCTRRKTRSSEDKLSGSNGFQSQTQFVATRIVSGESPLLQEKQTREAKNWRS